MPVHRYIPNSPPRIKQEMMKGLGVKDIDDLFRMIPTNMHLRKDLAIPQAASEYEVRRHIEDLLARNRSSNEMLCFLGAGCWPHHVPAVCDEVNSRSEFLTAYAGDVYSDLGRYQALFEFQSMIGDLVAMDVVIFPLYDWATACGDTFRMAVTITGRNEVLVPRTMSPDKLSIVRSLCGSLARLIPVNYDSVTGQMDLDDMRRKISANTACVYLENPTYLGFIETEAEEIGRAAHSNGALLVVGVEPLSLGALKPPGEYGADIVCGEGQPLGVHMNFGGGLMGFIACRDDERFVNATGHRLITVTSTERKGEWGFTQVLPGRNMYAAREKSKTFTGTETALWAITAAVYLSLLGPQGIQEIANAILHKSNYAIKRLSEISGLKVPLFQSAHFEEFTVNFDDVGKTVPQVNKALLRNGIQGGKDVGKEFPELHNTALYCVTEIHTKKDIDKLVDAMASIAG